MRQGLSGGEAGPPRAERIGGAVRAALSGAGLALVIGLLAVLGMAGMFRLVDDGSIIPHRPMSRESAFRFLAGTGALALGYVSATVMVFRRRAGRSFRIGWLVVALPVLGLMLLNPFTQCAVEALNRSATAQR